MMNQLELSNQLLKFILKLNKKHPPKYGYSYSYDYNYEDDVLDLTLYDKRFRSEDKKKMCNIKWVKSKGAVIKYMMNEVEKKCKL